MSADDFHRLEKRRMGIALRQQPQMGCKRLKTVDGGRRGDHPGCIHLQGLDLIEAQMLVEARAPYEAHAVAWLKNGLQPPRPACAHKAGMPAVGGRHHLKDNARLAMPAPAEHKAF